MKNFPGIFFTLLIVLSYLMPNQSLAQADKKEEDSLLIGGQIKLMGNDTVELLFGKNYQLSPVPCAEFYRIARINRYFQLEGIVKDYFVSNNRLACEAVYKDNILSGKYKSYFENGNLKSEGQYKDNLREGIWEYYYDNGQKKETIDFEPNFVKLIELYSRRGREVVRDGNGTFRENVFINSNELYAPLISGDVKNGFMDGRWVLSNQFLRTANIVEYYSNGKFVKGISYSLHFGEQEYTANPKCSFVDWDFTVNPDFYTQANDAYCMVNKHRPVKGDIDSISLSNTAFFPDFEKYLQQALLVNTKKDTGWVLVNFFISDKGIISKVGVHSVFDDDSLDQKIAGIFTKINLLPFASQKNEPGETRFFEILIQGNDYLLPEEAIYQARKLIK